MDFNSIMIGSDDAQHLIEYYRKLFGKPAMDQDSFAGWHLGTGWVAVGPHDKVQGKNSHPGRMIWNLETADVKGDFERLRDAGAIVVKEPYEPDGGGGGLIATFADPDDNFFQLMSPM